MFGWDSWKKGFDAWEASTAQYLEQWMKSPAVLTPAGAMLTAVMKTRAASDKAQEALVSAMGLATRRDQERTLHALNQLQSRLIDLEEKLDEARDTRRAPKTPVGSSAPRSGTSEVKHGHQPLP